MTVTLKVIAEAAGVSIPVVSQVLNSKGQRFRPETRRRVRQAACRLGYRPNSVARAMATGRPGCATLLLSTEGYRSTLPAELLRGIDGELARHNMHLTIARLPDEKLTSEGYVPKILREWLSEGLLINYTSDIPRKMLALIRGHDIPSVWINCRLHHDCVHPDDYDAGRLAGEHLLALGHRRLAYVCSWRPQDLRQAHYSARDRGGGLRAALRRAGLAPLRPPAYEADEPRRLELVRGWLADPRTRPTGVFCYGDRDAPILAASALQLGLRIPEDISILLCADEPFVRMGLRFTTLAVPAAAVGAEAVRMMLRKVEQPNDRLPRRAIPFELHAGGTSAPPPGAPSSRASTV